MSNGKTLTAAPPLAPAVAAAVPASIKIADTTANPGPLGLLCFALTTILLSAHNAGFFGLDAMILAMAVVPLVLRTLWLAHKKRFEHHRKIARVTFPVWLYVSVTGVIIYWMLYHLFPGIQGSAVAGANL